MKIIGTHDEITYIMLQCQKRPFGCEGCVLKVFCDKNRDIFLRLNPKQLDAIETGKLEPILITKGDNNASRIQQSSG